MERTLFLAFFFLSFFLCYLSLTRHASNTILSLTGSTPVIRKVATLLERASVQPRQWSRTSQSSSYPTVSFTSSDVPYYAPEYSIDSNWQTPVFTYAGYTHFNYSVVSVSSTPFDGARQ